MRSGNRSSAPTRTSWAARCASPGATRSRPMSLEIIGVMPPRFHFPRETQVWIPAAPLLREGPRCRTRRPSRRPGISTTSGSSTRSGACATACRVAQATDDLSAAVRRQPASQRRNGIERRHHTDRDLHRRPREAGVVDDAGGRGADAAARVQQRRGTASVPIGETGSRDRRAARARRIARHARASGAAGDDAARDRRCDWRLRRGLGDGARAGGGRADGRAAAGGGERQCAGRAADARGPDDRHERVERPVARGVHPSCGRRAAR